MQCTPKDIGAEHPLPSHALTLAWHGVGVRPGGGVHLVSPSRDGHRGGADGRHTTGLEVCQGVKGEGSCWKVLGGAKVGACSVRNRTAGARQR